MVVCTKPRSQTTMYLGTRLNLYRRVHIVCGIIMDFITELPPEVVARILSYLDVRDLLHCRAVSREWRENLEGHEQCWENACQQAGLSQCKIHEYSSRFSLPTIAAAVLKHRHWVTSSHSTVDSLVGSTDFNLRRVLHLLITSGPSNATCFLGHGFVTVGLQPPVDVRSVCTASKAMKKVTSHSHNPELDLIAKKKGRRNLLSYALTASNGWITWGKASPDYILFFTLRGKWIGYSPLTDEVLLEWEGGSSGPRGLLLGGHGGGSCYNISCCEKCFLVVTTEALFNSSPTWELQILKLGKGEVQPEVVDMRTILVKLQQEEKVLQWVLFPDLQRLDLAWEEMEPDFCPHHNLICICDTGISVYKIDLTMPEPKLIQKACQVKIPTCRCHVLHLETGLPCITSAQLSADNHLLGLMVKPFHFYVWSTQTWELLTTTHLSWVHTTVDTSRVIAVGHIYSVVATFEPIPGGNLHIVSTATGELLCERQSRVQWYAYQGLDFVQLINENWLNDIFCFNAPFFIYLNQSTQVYQLSCVQFAHHPTPPPHSKSWTKALFKHS